MEIRQTKWIIMDMQRKVVAKGTPRNRRLIFVDNKEDNKRLLTYSSKGKAEAGFKVSGFYCDGWFDEKDSVWKYMHDTYGEGWNRYNRYDTEKIMKCLQAVEVEIIIRTVEEDGVTVA